jgi:hypothetical protein
MSATRRQGTKVSKMPSPFRINPVKHSHMSATNKARALNEYSRNNSLHSTHEASFIKGNSSELKKVNDIGVIEVVNKRTIGGAGSQVMISNMFGKNTGDFNSIPNRNLGDFTESPIKKRSNL